MQLRETHAETNLAPKKGTSPTNLPSVFETMYFFCMSSRYSSGCPASRSVNTNTGKAAERALLLQMAQFVTTTQPLPCHTANVAERGQ